MSLAGEVAMEARMTLIEHTHERLLVALTVGLVIGICALDLKFPPGTSIVALYVIPILISLLSAEQWLPLATTTASLSLATLGFLSLPPNGPLWWVAPTNRALALATVTAVGCLALFYRRLADAEKTASARQRERVVARMKDLRGLLPVCSSCKNMRGDNGYWANHETYVEARSDAHFTNSLCPECQKRLYDSLWQHNGEEHGEPVLTR
jgi:uncharacterized membrane protein YccC